ncbi:hypothetical protein Q5P01_016242 [Channa striata]|uniref:Uncharacterized protein n=1 Tax=Channa striata TaxID=64152 RepID=A0AA88MDS2_CHASR|nr:hypothetical protein Q5P01_016242 [Channa striata]
MLFTVAVAGMAISPLSPLVPYVKLDKTTGEVTVASEKNSGLYSCTVIAEIPLYNFSNSSEKRIIILPPPEVSWIISWWMWILLGGSTIILTALLVICILLRRRWRRRRAPDPIYINTRPMVNKQPSPRPAGDKLKTAASAQNLRTPSPGGRYEDSKRRQRQGRC